MLIRSRKASDVRASEVTDESLYLNRRQFLGAAGALGLAAAAGAATPALARAATGSGRRQAGTGARPDDPATPYEAIISYNNFYEFGTDKSDPSDPELNKGFRAKPWSVRVEGLVSKPATYALDDFLKPHKLEERIYRHRCVEGWSMVIPWLGFPMRDLISRVQPLGSAKYVEFTTLYDAEMFPGQRRSVLDWPYTEGLRLDEAMHPLTLFAVGIYGRMLLPQNGAPLRHVVPWKYGFKGCKSIVKIRFTESPPDTAWNKAAAHEYGFYSNVNPTVDHPRWSQAKERRIGEFLRRPTLMFNGYDEVASLYAGMDLRKNY
jgi:sulfoxide reductase catalytic subunit YedY